MSAGPAGSETRLPAVQFTLQVDMSPEAIAARLRDLGQLYRLAMSLQQVEFLGRPPGK